MSGSNAYTPSHGQDVVAIYDNAFNPIFINARPMKASIKEIAKVMKHPVETGSTVTEHKIILPIEIDINMTLTPEFYVDTYHEIKSIFTGASTVQVQTNTGLYQSMVLKEMPHDEATEHFDTITMVLKFEQFIIISSKTTAISTQNGGTKAGKAATTTQTNDATTKTQKSSAAYSLLYGKGKE